MRTCDHCGTQNDDTRVFCGNCGTRLTAAASPDPAESPQPANAASAPALPAAGVTAPPLPQPLYRRPKRGPKPAPVSERSATGFLISSLFWLMVVSATLACLIQMVREPDSIPAAVGIDTAAAHETFSTLKELGASPKPISWTVNAKAINQYLESTIEMKPGELSLSP
ncbi:MAG: zinc ribbon domain-containing protein, partial [Verrucomicrobiota bacterium]